MTSGSDFVTKSGSARTGPAGPLATALHSSLPEIACLARQIFFGDVNWRDVWGSLRTRLHSVSGDLS